MTTHSSSSKAVDSVIHGQINAYMKSEGFRRSGRTFHRPKDEMIQVVNFQTTWLNTPDEARFTINLDVVLPFYHEKWAGQPFPKNPGSAAAICSRRLGHLLPEGTDKWWTVTPSSDCDALSHELADLLRSIGVPYLDEATDLQFLCENLGSDKRFPGMLASQPVAYAILLCYLGREHDARDVLKAIRRKNRIDGFGKTIDLIERRLGLASNQSMESTK